MKLHLLNGTVIDDPLAEALDFIARDGTYQGYDAQPSDPDHLTPGDIRLANRMIARMGADVAGALLDRAPRVDQALADIPHDSTLASEVDWPALRRLFYAVDGIRGVGLARATKVLHKKRPALVPILDDVVAGYLGTVAASSMTERGVRLTRKYQRELMHGLPVLSSVRGALAERGFDLTECRILDMYLWGASGAYEPLWKRRDASPSGRPSRGPDPWIGLPDTLTRFTKDDDGYLRWLRANPSGYVLNCAHRPRADYLKLHRPDCAHLRRAGMTNLTGAYTKVCGSRASLIDEWLRSALDATADRCPACFR